MKFKKKFTLTHIGDDYPELDETYLEFTGEKNAWSRGRILKTKKGWYFENVPCDPGQEHHFSAKQLRQIADKVDDLNGGQK